MTVDIKCQTGLLWQDSQHSEWISLPEELKNAIEDNQDHQVFAKNTKVILRKPH